MPENNAQGRVLEVTKTKAFNPPGPGAWVLETTHWSRPMTSFMQEALVVGITKGLGDSAARYGTMLSHLEPGFVNGFAYLRAVGFGAPPDAVGQPPKLAVQILTRVLPKMRKRVQTAHDAMKNKLWRHDLARWDALVKPAAISKHRKLQSVDLSSLNDAGLVSHVLETHAHLTDMIEQHHHFTVTAAVPIGDFLAHVQEWTGKPPGEILQVLRGSSKISLGPAQEELATLAAAISENPAARAILASADSAQSIIDALLVDESVAKPMEAYLDMVKVRCLGYDLGMKSVGEMPEIIVRSIQARVDGLGAWRDDPAAAQARIASLRQAVPFAHHAAFDVLLEEALIVNRLRDERGQFSDGWAIGIARRALGEVGRRLVARGTFTSAELAFEASRDEIVALIGGQSGPSEAELVDRAAWRAEKRTSDPDVPPWLGTPPAPPPPAEWLPLKGRRTARAIATYMATVLNDPEAKTTLTTVTGLPVSPGIYEGTARLVDDEADFGRIQYGDVLVARNTSPYINLVLPLLGAIVTDRGGQLCHAAIVAREYGIPGVVGTRDACKLVRDGTRVRVNGTTGEVSVLA
jgi:rifampicin phosphotransferase